MRDGRSCVRVGSACALTSCVTAGASRPSALLHGAASTGAVTVTFDAGKPTRRTRATLLAAATPAGASTSMRTSNASGVPSLSVRCRPSRSAAFTAQVDTSRRSPRDNSAAAGTSRRRTSMPASSVPTRRKPKGALARAPRSMTTSKASPAGARGPPPARLCRRATSQRFGHPVRQRGNGGGNAHARRADLTRSASTCIAEQRHGARHAAANQPHAEIGADAGPIGYAHAVRNCFRLGARDQSQALHQTSGFTLHTSPTNALPVPTTTGWCHYAPPGRSPLSCCFLRP